MHRAFWLAGWLLTASGVGTVYVGVGQLQPVELHEMKSVETADPSIAQVSVYEPGVALVMGNKSGATDLRWTDTHGAQHVTHLEVGQEAPPEPPKAFLKKLEVRVGGELVLPPCELTRVESEDPSVASVRAVTDLRAGVRGVKPGVTRVTYWNSKNEPTTFEVTVHPLTPSSEK